MFDLGTREQVTASFLQFHWLEVRWRIQFKLCCLVHLSPVSSLTHARRASNARSKTRLAREIEHVLIWRKPRKKWPMTYGWNLSRIKIIRCVRTLRALSETLRATETGLQSSLSSSQQVGRARLHVCVHPFHCQRTTWCY